MAVYKKIMGKTVYFKPVRLADTEFTYNIRQDKERTKYMHQVGGGIQAQEKWIQNQIQRDGDYFFVVYSMSHIPIGTASIYNINDEMKRGEIGRIVLNGNKIQNMEAIIIIHEFGFYDLGMETLDSEILVDNIASIGTTLRVGGVERMRVFNKELNSEVIWYEIKKSDYEKKREYFKALINRFGTR